MITPKPKTRYRTYTRGEEYPLRIAIHPDETTINPDPDHRHSRLLKLGWSCEKIDPIPGVSRPPDGSASAASG